ncbi:hypothetical protein BpHYR1_030104 [Brachionus plicatilis]|uniref:Uncharacterized protein n=1 Tax=Brachionus plicatilis TaxID=10195 RepID=A0A3M7PVC7_BRAPC|nr:hypothetical protein BpHYR1_030104 [Brachionus plicatilis]
MTVPRAQKICHLNCYQMTSIKRGGNQEKNIGTKLNFNNSIHRERCDLNGAFSTDAQRIFNLKNYKILPIAVKFLITLLLIYFQKRNVKEFLTQINEQIHFGFKLIDTVGVDNILSIDDKEVRTSNLSEHKRELALSMLKSFDSMLVNLVFVRADCTQFHKADILHIEKLESIE